MPTITIPSEPVPALDPFDASVEYTQDQNAQFARQDLMIDNASLTVGDTFTFNGTAFTYNTVLNSPTDFTGNENFVNQFNANPDFNTDYEAVITSGVFGSLTAVYIRITAKIPTAQLNITASRATINPDTIELQGNVLGQSTYSKNDIANFAQLARIEGTTVDNEQVNTGSTYFFELSSQVESQLNYYDIANANGVLFSNELSYKTLGIQFGTRYTTAGSTYRIREYEPAIPFFTYLGKGHELGALTDRIGSKTSSVELYEIQSFLLFNETSTTNLQRHIVIEYTDNTSTTDVDGSLNNPTNGIVSCLSYVNSFSSLVDNTKVIKSWTVSLADSNGDVLYQGQKYLNLAQACVSYFQVLYTNVYGGFEVVTFKTDPTNSFTTESQESKEASLPNKFKEFNFVTDTSEIISIDEQAINEQEYQILKGLPQSKYTYVVDGFDLKPVRLTAYKLDENSFNGNFKCLG
jgi:hypothetical protein